MRVLLDLAGDDQAVIRGLRWALRQLLRRHGIRVRHLRALDEEPRPETEGTTP